MAHTITGAPAASSVAEPGGPVDIHAQYMHHSVGGFEYALLLRPVCVQSLAANLRGIRAIVAVLSVESGSGDIELGEWIRSGLVDAIDALALSSSAILDENASERPCQGGRHESR